MHDYRNMNTMGELRQFAAQAGKVMGKDLYGYAFVFPIAELTAGATITKSVTIETDSHFLWEKATFFAKINTTAALTLQTRPVPQVTFQWRDTASSRQMFNTPIPITTFWGVGEIPMILPEPKLLVPTSVLTIDATNNHSTEAYELTLLMLGSKILLA